MSTSELLFGSVVAHRYEIVSRIKASGGAVLYRAHQRAPERDVAIKILRGAPDSSERFMAAVRAAVRMNHPNVSSVFDFGRTTLASGEEALFVVTELVFGIDLAEVLARVGTLPLSRVTNIHRQLLQALSEAHRVGAVHGDMTPENVVLALGRAGRDYVKLIDFDFGVTDEPRDKPRVLHDYVGPEQAAGAPASVAGDLYSVAIVLFEMLTGRLPFERSSSTVTWSARWGSARTDPREIAPGRGIPDALAEVCVRALAIRPEERFPTADAFADALRRATPEPRSLSKSDPASRGAGDRSSKPSIELPGPGPLFGRAADLAWAKEHVQNPAGPSWVAFCGRPGIGRTRLLEAVAEDARRNGFSVIVADLSPAPYDELGYSGLSSLLSCLSDLSSTELARRDPLNLPDRASYDDFSDLLIRSRGRRNDPDAMRRAAGAALAWAGRRAATRAKGRRTLLVIDNVDRLDRPSCQTLCDYLEDDIGRDLTVVSTSDHEPAAPWVATRALAGLSRPDALRMLASLKRDDSAAMLTDDDIEPLYVDELHYAISADLPAMPLAMNALVEWRVQRLAGAERRLLQAIAVVGMGDVGTLSSLVASSDPGGRHLSSEEIDEAIASLVAAGFIAIRSGEVIARHAIFARTAIACAPGDAIAGIHAAAAELLGDAPEWLELRTYHAIRGRGDFASFLLVEHAARLRSQRGDDAGAIAVLEAAVDAARINVMRGEGGAAIAAWNVFGRKLGAAYLHEKRLDEAERILLDLVGVAGAADVGRALAMEQLALVAELRGDVEGAAHHRREALEIAEANADENLAERLRTRLAVKTPIPRVSVAQEAPGSERRHRPVLVVEDDRAIREGLKSVVESDGREAYGAANGKEALELLRKIPRPGLILLDLMMPVMTGWEVLERLRADEAFATIPVVVVSAVPKQEELGAVRVLQKPVDVTTLLRLIEEFCD